MENCDYSLRGKCKEESEKLVAADPSLRLVRGWYWSWSWGKQGHWWCVKPDGTIVDPTRDQFPKPHGADEYEAFDGMCECGECGKEFPESQPGAKFEGRYACCSDRCMLRLVGLA